jgi:hypothetical protein
MLTTFIGLAEISKPTTSPLARHILAPSSALVSGLHLEKCEIAASLCCAINNSHFLQSRRRFCDASTRGEVRVAPSHAVNCFLPVPGCCLFDIIAHMLSGEN